MANPRADYSPIFHRPPLKLPGNARIAIWPVINVEEWDINETMARAVLPTPQGVALQAGPGSTWNSRHGKSERVCLSELPAAGAGES